MQYDFVWNFKAKLWVVVDRFDNDRPVSVHWTTGEAKKQIALYEDEQGPLLAEAA